MTRMVNCAVLGAESPGLKRVPYPGELGQRIFDNVSEEGWNQWIERQTMIINENGLSTVDPASLALIEQHMLGFFLKKVTSGSSLRDSGHRELKNSTPSLCQLIQFPTWLGDKA